ncbi:MAG: biosynthetic peptidoglycan transglycosylase, partial [Polyangiaceae bacterium]
MTVQHVVPTWTGIRLRGVDVTIEEIPGVTIWLDDVVVGWDKRPKAMDGGKIMAVGELDDLVTAAEAWRRARFSSGGGSGDGKARRLAIEGFELDWSRGAGDRSRSVHLTELELVRDGKTIDVGARSAQARWGGAELSVTEGRLVLARGDEGYRVREMTTKAAAIELAVSAPAEGEPAVAEEVEGEPAPTGDTKPAKSGTDAPDPGAAPPNARVQAARRLHDALLKLGARADALVEPDAHIGVNGARATIRVGDETLNVGPGAFRVTRDAADIVVALEPRADAREARALTFSVRLPLREDDDGKAPSERPVEGQIRGGPMWLSVLGVKDGDLGLRDVSKASVEADVRLVLPPDGSSVSLVGSGMLDDLTLERKRLAATPLENLDLAWRARLDYRLDGSRLTVHDAEVDLGDIRGLFRGTFDKRAEGVKVDMTYDMPLVECQRAFDSIPKAMVPRLEGMRFVGSLAAKGHARFDTANLDRDYDVDRDGTMSCRIVDAPPSIDVSRFRTRFDKLVYTAKKEERTASFGPETDSWVPLSGISRFMVGAVLTTEDGRFFRHAGFDQEAIVNSMKENLKQGRFVRGASTISMQLAKNLYLPRTKTIARKLQEAILTMYLEQELTKDEIMELYLNVIEYGPDVYGIGPAARHYFNGHASSLSLGQALYLGSILSNPLESHFGAGGAVTPNRMGYLKTLMKIVHKIGR